MIIKRLLPITILALTSFVSTSGAEPRTSLPSAEGVTLKLPYSNMALSGEFVGAAVADKDWYVWCFSPIVCPEDGKIHAFVSRWPAETGMEGWIEENAEIAHYVAENPEGPFEYVSTIMKTAMFPDRSSMRAPHNPRLEMVDGKYILLYICQDPTPGGHRQRVGMMVSEAIDGPWRFAGDNGGIMVECQDDDPEHWTYHGAIGADNPAFLKIGDKYYIYFRDIQLMASNALRENG